MAEENFKRRCGRWGEERAAQLLERKGLKILHRNWRHGHGEIDLVAQDGELTVFVEVRVRRSRALVSGFQSLTKKKRETLGRTALAFLEKFPATTFYRWDVVEFRLVDPQFRRYEALHYENVPLLEDGENNLSSLSL
ncbi:MAG: YraN family protein [Puniceicoccales bacterium]|jgi:putative endonuclease|nr:YraN family protein [Puniceicoccales bacterium]